MQATDPYYSSNDFSNVYFSFVTSVADSLYG